MTMKKCAGASKKLFKIGDQILLFHFRRKERKGGCVIEELHENGTVSLKGRKQKAHCCNLKKFTVQHSPSVSFCPPTADQQNEVCSHIGIKHRNQLNYKRNGSPMGKSYSVKLIIGDGNCLYRALSAIFTGQQDNHDIIRSSNCINYKES